MSPRQFQAAIPLAEALINVFQSNIGSTMEELDEALRKVADAEPNRMQVAGFIKLLRDRCEIGTAPECDPAALRAEVFRLATQQRRALGIREPFHRSAVIDACAARQHCTPEQLESMLFADLPGAQLLSSMQPITPIDLLHRYNLALAQGILLRSTQVTIHLVPTTATRIRQLIRAMRFRRLMFQITGSAQSGYEIVLDGPMSLFESTQRYGIQLALFLPALVAEEGWSLKARLRWGKERKKAVLSISDQDGFVSPYRKDSTELEEISTLVESFSRLDCPWSVRRSSRIFHLQNQSLFVPDLVFEKDNKLRVYLEAFGTWNRDAVFDRVQILQQELGERFILAVSKKLRVSPEIACDDFPLRILVYGSAISAHSVWRLLEDIVKDV